MLHSIFLHITDYMKNSSTLPRPAQHYCACKSKCANKRCPCKRKGLTCNANCHLGKSCSNTKNAEKERDKRVQNVLKFFAGNKKNDTYSYSNNNSYIIIPQMIQKRAPIQAMLQKGH